MVKKLLEKRPTKAVTVYVDMKDVDRAAKKVCTSMIVLQVAKTRFELSTILQKDVSGDSEDDSDNEGQSDVSICFLVNNFSPHIILELKWAYENRFRVGTFTRLARKEVLK